MIIIWININNCMYIYIHTHLHVLKQKLDSVWLFQASKTEIYLAMIAWGMGHKAILV